MPSSSLSLRDILGPDGRVAKSLQDFEFRPSQLQMAEVIDGVLGGTIPAIIEAGTGTGKTLGYLAPLVLSGKKAVISTGTKNLQEQIFLKDIPLLSRATGLEIDSTLMKGRKNYLCLYRYEQYFSQPSLFQPKQEKVKKRIESWLENTEFSDRSELTWMADDDPLWDGISATSEQCLGSACMYWDDCFFNALRRSAARSRIIIVNHHLFFADLMVKKRGFGEIIPRFQVAIFDEAHNLEEIATSYLGERLSTHQLMEFVHDLEREIKANGDRLQKGLKKHLNLIKNGANALSGLFIGFGDSRGRLDEALFKLINEGPASLIREGLDHIQSDSELKELEQASSQAFVLRAGELSQRLERVLSHGDPDWLNWYERRKKTVALHASPLEVAESMEGLLYSQVKTMVFTSATLSTNGNFDYFRTRLGLTFDVVEEIFPSHFDFKEQTLLYIPKDLPPPNNPNFGPEVGKRVSDILTITSGRALVLFTSYHNLNLVHQLLGGAIPYTLFKQGEAPRSVLLEKFKRDTHSVLLATASFWQGVDVPGEALSCLIIDKIPFDSPAEPLVSARIESIQSRGGNPFMEYQLPSAIISLKQGLGRLIRNSADRGVLSILDTRMITSRYGRFFLDSLPEMPLSHEISDLKRFFE